MSSHNMEAVKEKNKYHNAIMAISTGARGAFSTKLYHVNCLDIAM